MANEMKAREGNVAKATDGTEVKVTEGVDIAATVSGADVEDNLGVQLKLERRKIKTKDKREMWVYEINGFVSKRPVKADISGKVDDPGAYEVLDLIFDVAAEAKHDVLLIVRDEKMTDDSGRSSIYTVYEAYTTDGEGNELVCPVRPSRGSDKSLLQMVIAQLPKGGVTA